MKGISTEDLTDSSQEPLLGYAEREERAPAGLGQKLGKVQPSGETSSVAS